MSQHCVAALCTCRHALFAEGTCPTHGRPFTTDNQPTLAGTYNCYFIILDKAILVGVLSILAAFGKTKEAAICAVVITSISFLSSCCAKPYLTPEEDRLDRSARFANLLNAGKWTVCSLLL